MGNIDSEQQQTEEDEKDPKILDDEDTEYLEYKTGLTKEEIVSWHNRFLAEQPDGILKLDKFIRIYSEFYPFGNPEKYAKIAFKAFDVDKSGTITFKEFMIAVSFGINKEKAGDFESSLNYAFNVFDLNDDGKISRKEMLLMVESMYTEFGQDVEKARKKVDDIFKKYDTDKSEQLEKEEFIRFIISDQIASRIFL